MRKNINLRVALSSFIGRKQEIDEVIQLLRTTRLLSLTGASGGGKTHLSMQVMADLVDLFGNGIWWVDLASCCALR